MTTPIPTGMDDLTPEWLTQALGSEVTDVKRQQIGTGQIADSVRCSITYADGRADNTSLVAKVTSADESSRRAALMTRTYEKEVGFYGDLAASLPVRTPRCYWTGFDQSQAAYAVLLEDLAPAHQGDQMQGCTIEEAGLAIDELALLHGPTWNATNLEGRSWLDRGTGTTDPASGSLVEMLLTGFLERYEARLPADVVELAQRVVPKLPHARPLAEGNAPHALTHGDFRNDNLMFGGTDGRVCVLDWQTPGIGHPVSDLSYFLGGSLLVEDRRAHEHDLLDGYRQGLTKHGVELTEAECWTAYRRYAFSGLNMAIIASMIVGRTDRGDDMFMAMAERAGRHALDLDSEALL